MQYKRYTAFGGWGNQSPTVAPTATTNKLVGQKGHVMASANTTANNAVTGNGSSTTATATKATVTKVAKPKAKAKATQPSINTKLGHASFCCKACNVAIKATGYKGLVDPTPGNVTHRATVKNILPGNVHFWVASNPKPSATNKAAKAYMVSLGVLASPALQKQLCANVQAACPTVTVKVCRVGNVQVAKCNPAMVATVASAMVTQAQKLLGC